MNAFSPWTLRLVVESPFAFRGDLPHPSLDLAQARDDAGRLILPGTQMRGLLRDALFTVARAQGTNPETDPELMALFGTPSPEGSNDPARGTLDLADLVAETAPPPAEKAPPLTRVAVDDDLGAVKEGHMLVVEMPYPLGQQVAFSTVLWLDETQAQKILTCLPLITAVGAFKSAGFGQVRSISLEKPKETPAATPTPLTADSEDLLVTFTVDRPFLVDASKATANLFKGAEVIPGGVVKAVLAGALTAEKALDEATSQALAAVTLGHAWPVPQSAAEHWEPGKRVMPLSLVHFNKAPHDLLLSDHERGAVLRDNKETVLPPIFSVDWKDKDDTAVREALGFETAYPTRALRTRTAIDYETNTALWAEEEGGRVFSYSSVRPEGFVWIARWHGPRETLQTFLTRAAAGLPNMGKTRARLTAIAAQPFPPTAHPCQEGETWALTLQTNALLTHLPDLPTAPDFNAVYGAYFQEQGLTLKRFFARQQLAGGYQAYRYPQQTDRYTPYLLTRAGSVFLVQGPAETVNQLVRTGLPLPAAIPYRTWETCPFLPENGYGAVLTNVVDHGGLLPNRLEAA